MLEVYKKYIEKSLWKGIILQEFLKSTKIKQKIKYSSGNKYDKEELEPLS